MSSLLRNIPFVALPPIEKGPQKKLLFEKITDPNILFGYIKSIKQENGKTFIEVDLAEFISNGYTTGTAPGAADIAEIEDGKCGVPLDQAVIGECAGSGFYIRNNSTATETFEIPLTAKFELLPYTGDGSVGSPKTVSMSNFISVFHDPTRYAKKYYAPQDPYSINLINGKVVKITSQYIP